MCCQEWSPSGEKVAEGCTHPRTICHQCVQRHIHEEVRGKGQVTDIRCPLVASAECGATLTYGDVQRQASAADFEQYDRLLLLRTLEAMPEFLWCARPGCGNGQLHPDRDRQPIFSCQSCGTRTCFTHRCVWHAGRTCAQYDSDAKASEEVALLQALDGGQIKRCPKCHHGIEKTDGCDHMTCQKRAGGCGYEFCWLCLADYNKIRQNGNTSHKPSCRYYM